MSLSTDELADLLRSAVLLPVLRAPDVEAAQSQVEACAAAGLPAVELTTTTPGWADAVRAVRAAWPSLVVGVGTVLAESQAEEAVAAGAAFLVSPCPVPDVRRVAAGRLPFLEGGFTPAELLDISSRGLAKLFPAHVGGPQMLRSMLALRPEARIVPTGGIAVGDVPAWLKSGALAVGVGAALLDEDDLPGRVQALHQAARDRSG